MSFKSREALYKWKLKKRRKYAKKCKGLPPEPRPFNNPDLSVSTHNAYTSPQKKSGGKTAPITQQPPKYLLAREYDFSALPKGLQKLIHDNLLPAAEVMFHHKGLNDEVFIALSDGVLIVKQGVGGTGSFGGRMVEFISYADLKEIRVDKGVLITDIDFIRKQFVEEPSGVKPYRVSISPSEIEDVHVKLDRIELMASRVQQAGSPPAEAFKKQALPQPLPSTLKANRTEKMAALRSTLSKIKKPVNKYPRDEPEKKKHGGCCWAAVVLIILYYIFG